MGGVVFPDAQPEPVLHLLFEKRGVDRARNDDVPIGEELLDLGTSESAHRGESSRNTRGAQATITLPMTLRSMMS